MHSSYVPSPRDPSPSTKLPPVVRNAKKLTELLETSHSVTSDLITKTLTIIVGDARDSTAVTQTLFPTVLNPTNPTSGNNAVNLIVSGMGCYPVMKKGYWLPQQEDPTLCQDAITTIFNALRSRRPVVKPGLVMLSTQGISKFGRDYPLLLMPLYALLLHRAHEDKRVMENLASEAVKEEEGPIESFVIVRPSLLTAGKAYGLKSVRWDIEDGGVAKNAIGYWISRADVGGFVFENVVLPFQSGKAERVETTYSITY